MTLLPKAGGIATSKTSFGHLLRETDHHARRRRQGAIANPVAADALDPVAIDRAGAGADRGAGDRAAAAVELARGVWRGVGGSDARPRLPHPAQCAGLDHLDRRRVWRGIRRSVLDARDHLAGRE